MNVIVHDEQIPEKWRDGVVTRMRMSALLGSHRLCIFDQYCDPGRGAPTHVHAVEEVLEVIEGTAKVWVGEESTIVRRNQSVLIPAGVRHGFCNVEQTSKLQVRATLAACIFEVTYDGEDHRSLRWSPGELT